MRHAATALSGDLIGESLRLLSAECSLRHRCRVPRVMCHCPTIPRGTCGHLEVQGPALKPLRLISAVLSGKCRARQILLHFHPCPILMNCTCGRCLITTSRPFPCFPLWKARSRMFRLCGSHRALVGVGPWSHAGTQIGGVLLSRMHTL